MFELKTTKQVRKFLKSLDKKTHKRCLDGFDNLSEDPFQKRSGCDIRKLSGKKEVYRLRIGNMRFEYVVDKEKIIVYVEGAFSRERGYR